MAHSLSAKKRIRQAAKRNARNRTRKQGIKDSIKAFTSAIATGDFKKAAEELTGTVRRLDRVAVKGTIHRKSASRKRSRLTKRLNAAVISAKTKPVEAAPAKGKARSKKAKAAGAGSSD